MREVIPHFSVQHLKSQVKHYLLLLCSIYVDYINFRQIMYIWNSDFLITIAWRTFYIHGTIAQKVLYNGKSVLHTIKMFLKG